MRCGGRVEKRAEKGRSNAPYTLFMSATMRPTSSWICDSMTKMCESSCWNWRTRVRPPSDPDASLRWRTSVVK
jgi:hypothetical protein